MRNFSLTRLLRLGSATRQTRAVGPGPFMELNANRYWSEP